jgi:hypothetical protein
VIVNGVDDKEEGRRSCDLGLKYTALLFRGHGHVLDKTNNNRIKPRKCSASVN